MGQFIFWIFMVAIGALWTAYATLQMTDSWNKLHKQNVEAKPEINATISGSNNIVAGGDVTIQKTAEPSQSDLERQKKESDPKVGIKLEQKQGELLIKIRAEKNVSTLALDIPILGKVINIHNNNSVADAVTRSKRVVGANSDTSANNVELLIDNIKPVNELSYKVIFRPLPKSIVIAGTDRYKISYTWQFAGNTFSREGWISLQTGEPVDIPQVQVKGFNVINRALSPEEIKKLYEDGLKKREIE